MRVGQHENFLRAAVARATDGLTFLPLPSKRRAMCLGSGAVNQHLRGRSAGLQVCAHERVERVGPHAILRPSNKAAVERLPRTVFQRRIDPATARLQHCMMPLITRRSSTGGCRAYRSANVVRSKVRTVGRQIQEFRPCRLDRRADACALASAEIVHDHDAARSQFRDQNLVVIGLEPDVVDGPVENHWRDHSYRSQRADGDRHFPMSMRNACAKPLALRSTIAATRHIGRGPCLVNEDETRGSRSR